MNLSLWRSVLCVMGSLALCAPLLGQLTAEQDRARLLGLLGLTESQMRPRPDGNPRSPNSTNYDLAKSSVYSKLPNPLLFKDGRPVKSVVDWAERSKEIRADFDREILGHTPASLPSAEWRVISTKTEKYGGVNVVTKRLSGHVGKDSPEGFDIDLLLTVPEHAAGPVPVVMELAFEDDFKRAKSGPLDSYSPLPWGVDGKLVVQRGWGFAILNAVSIQKDDGSGLTSGIIGLVNHGKPRSVEDWGALKAWA